jgi:hypothetical protein
MVHQFPNIGSTESGYSSISVQIKARTVNKLQRLNLHFSSMFCIERKVVHVGAEKSLRFIYIKFPSNLKIFSFTFNDEEDYARGEI